LYSGGAIPSKIDAAKAEYNKSFFAEQKVLLTAKALIRNYTQVLAELRNQIDLSRLMRENAQKHLSLAQRSYDAGLGSQLDLKDAETAVINADVYFVRARYDYLMILAKLSNTVGLEEDYICER
jgi:outer membrane protein TolC